MWIPFVGELLEDALTAHLPRVPPVLLPWIISSIKSSPFWSVYFVLYFYCTRICMQRKNVETLKMYREILSGAAESETHDPKSSKEEPKTPQSKKKKNIYENWNAQEDIEFDSIRKCCLTWRRVLFISLNCLRDKVYLTGFEVCNWEIHTFILCMHRDLSY